MGNEILTPDSLFIPAHPAVYEEKIKRSVFIAELEICDDERQARDFLARVISKHRDANHNCRAYIINKIEYSSDDGEPSGTAGKPILGAIKKSGLVNVMIIVTRYFGGVKLGVRGLIDAYGGTAEKVLELSGRVEKIKTRNLEFSFNYNDTGFIARLLEQSGAENIFYEYGEKVKVNADIPVKFFENFSEKTKSFIKIEKT